MHNYMETNIFVANATDFCFAFCYDANGWRDEIPGRRSLRYAFGSGRDNRTDRDGNKQKKDDIDMKKIVAMIMALVLVMGLCAFANAEGELTVTAPNGAPALAIAALVVDKPETYTPVAPDTIGSAFSGGEADFIIAPVNAGALMYKKFLKGELSNEYKLAAMVSWGNLFFAAQKADLTAEDLNGAIITLFGENTINASVVLYALEQNGIVPADVKYLNGADKTKDLLLSDPEAIVVTAEPALTAAKFSAKKEDKTISSLSVNELLAKVTGEEGYAQAGLFVKAETAIAQPEAVEAWLKAAEEACGKCTTDVAAVAEAAVALEILPNAKVAEAAIPGCAIRYVNAKDAKELIEKTAAIDLKQFGGDVPADDFYYGAE